MREIADVLLEIPEIELNNYLDNECLESHTVSVFIPQLTRPDLYQFIKDNSEMLIDLMLTAWTFPMDKWGFDNKNIELLEKIIDVKYYPVVCQAITKPVKNTLDLAITLATPTPHLVDYIAECITSNKMTLTDDEMTELSFILSTGIAIITNQLEMSDNQDPIEFCIAVNNSEKYLVPLKDKIVKTLFYFYFKNSENFPEEIDNMFLNKWFDTKTFIGIFMFPI